MASIDKNKLGEYLSAYLDDELSDQERSAVESLAARDPGVGRQLEQLRRTVELVRGLPHRAAPPSLSENLTATAERDQLLGAPGEAVVIQMPWWRSLRPMLSAAAVLVIAVGGGFYVFNNMGSTGDRFTPSVLKVVPDPSARSAAPAAAVEDAFEKSGTTALADGRSRAEEPPAPATLTDDVAPGPVDEAEETRLAFAERTEPLGVARERKIESAERGLADSYLAKKRETPPVTSPPTGVWSKLTFKQKSDLGVNQADLLDHSFANESNVLTVLTVDAADAALARQQVAGFFVSNSFRDVELLGADAKLSANQRLYYMGRPGVNYEGSAVDEVIVQLPAAEVSALVSALATNESGTRGQQLALGAVVAHGSDEIRRVVARIQPQPARAWVALADWGDTRAKDALSDPAPADSRRPAVRSRARGVMLPSGAGAAKPASESTGAAPAASMRAKRAVETDRADADQDAVTAASQRGGGLSDKRSSRRVSGGLEKLVMRVLAPTRAAKEGPTEAADGDDRRPLRTTPDKPGQLVRRNLVQLDTKRPDRTAPGASAMTPSRQARSVESAEQFITLVVQFVQRTDAASPPTRENPVEPPAATSQPDDGGGS